MLEVPAAALRASSILAEVDFVSIGTNDLAQYTMAADRVSGEPADLLDPWQPAVPDLVVATACAGAAARKPVEVCGEWLSVTTPSSGAGRSPRRPCPHRPPHRPTGPP
ncbi:putative PEP-binding protein [Streptomyces sp. NPDC000878]